MGEPGANGWEQGLKNEGEEGSQLMIAWASDDGPVKG